MIKSKQNQNDPAILAESRLTSPEAANQIWNAALFSYSIQFQYSFNTDPRIRRVRNLFHYLRIDERFQYRPAHKAGHVAGESSCQHLFQYRPAHKAGLERST